MAGTTQPKTKKQPSPAEKPEASSSGKKSPSGVSSGPAPKPAAAAPQEKTKLAQDKNLNIIERKAAREPKNGERKKSWVEERQGSRPASRDKSASPSSKGSSKSSSPLPMAAGCHPVPTSPSSLSKCTDWGDVNCWLFSCW